MPPTPTANLQSWLRLIVLVAGMLAHAYLVGHGWTPPGGTTPPAPAPAPAAPAPTIPDPAPPVAPVAPQPGGPPGVLGGVAPGADRPGDAWLMTTLPDGRTVKVWGHLRGNEVEWDEKDPRNFYVSAP